MSSRNQYNGSRRLNTEFNKVYGSSDIVDDIAFYVDEQTEEYYQWKFETPDKKTHVWKYYFATKTITKGIIN